MNYNITITAEKSEQTPGLRLPRVFLMPKEKRLFTQQTCAKDNSIISIRAKNPCSTYKIHSRKLNNLNTRSDRYDTRASSKTTIIQSMYLVSIRRRNIIVLCPQVGCCNYEVHMKICVVVFLELNRQQLKAKFGWLRQRIPQLLYGLWV